MQKLYYFTWRTSFTAYFWCAMFRRRESRLFIGSIRSKLKVSLHFRDIPVKKLSRVKRMEILHLWQSRFMNIVFSRPHKKNLIKIYFVKYQFFFICNAIGYYLIPMLERCHLIIFRFCLATWNLFREIFSAIREWINIVIWYRK